MLYVSSDKHEIDVPAVPWNILGPVLQRQIFYNQCQLKKNQCQLKTRFQMASDLLAFSYQPNISHVMKFLLTKIKYEMKNSELSMTLEWT